MRLYQYLFLALICAVVNTSVYSQNTGSIKGVLKDSSGKQVLSLATVTVFVAKDTTIVTYRLSDPSGNFRIPGIPLAVPCRVLISYSGYKTYRKDFTLSKETAQLDMGVISLKNESKDLEEVIVYAERPPVTVKKDTIEFNAAAFKTLPTALLEDLLKKFPGIEIDAEGNILVKGKRVNRLLVEGKEFFGGDPQIATKNLPANIVDKVQVMNDKEEMDKNPLTPESEIGQIINIKLKRSIKEGWFGKAYAGRGTDSHYETGAIINAFRDTVQISVLGYSNNINRAGFNINDIQRIGGFDRSGTQGVTTWGNGGLEINGISFGATGQGRQLSSGAGANFNTQYGKNVTMNLQYFYGQVNSEYESKNNQQRFFKDTILTTFSTTAPQSVNISHRAGGMVKWVIDSLTSLTFRPGVTITNTRNENLALSETAENYRGRINDSRVQTNGRGESVNTSFNLYLSREFKKTGRSLNFTTDFSNVNNENNNYTNGLYTTFRNGFPEDSLVNQLRHTVGDNLNSNSYVYFTEPLSSKLSFVASDNFTYLKQSNVIDFLDHNNVSGKYDEVVDLFSNSINRQGWKNIITTSLQYRHKKFMVRPALNYLAADFTNRFTKNPSVDQTFQFLYPSLNISLGIVSISYRAGVQEPDASNLQEVIDISNRFFQQYGNPNLKPSYSQNLSLDVSKYFQNSGSSVYGYVFGGTTDNAVIRAVTIDRDGIQTTRPINVDGTYRANSGLSYSYQYKFNQNFKFNLRAAVYAGFNKSFVLINNVRSGQWNQNLGPQLTLGINYRDKIEISQIYLENYRQTKYDRGTTFRNQNVTSRNTMSEITIRMPKHFVWENQINYTYNPQVASGLRKSVVRWNAGINYLFLREEKGQLKLSVFDLLNQNVSVYRSTGENYIMDVQSSTLTRYFMLTFTYNLRNFSGGKTTGAKRGMFLF